MIFPIEMQLNTSFHSNIQLFSRFFFNKYIEAWRKSVILVQYFFGENWKITGKTRHFGGSRNFKIGEGGGLPGPQLLINVIKLIIHYFNPIMI